MLLWEALAPTAPVNPSDPNKPPALEKPKVLNVRLPYDTRCSAVTRAGHRCRGRIIRSTDFCFFHDPELTAERRKRMLEKGREERRLRTHLPDGYLRKLTSRTAVGEAMDRLYREVRKGIVSREMGMILFNILVRLLDSELVKSGSRPERSKASRIRPKLHQLLTQDEIQAIMRASGKVEEIMVRPERPAPQKRKLASASGTWTAVPAVALKTQSAS